MVYRIYVEKKAGQTHEADGLLKEIKDFLRISFYANNAFRSTPLWESTKTPGSFRRRNDRAFFFGLSLNATIK